MTRDEQLFFCRQCLNRKMDPMNGLVCGLTDKPANFEDKCIDFNHDTSVTLPTPVQEQVAPHEAVRTLSGDVLAALQLEQNLPMGITAGAVVGIIGAVLWAAITAATNYQIGYMALAIGAGVGFGVRYGGNGIDPVFGYAGAGLAILSCVLGNFLSVMAVLADSEGLGYIEILFAFDYSYFFDLMSETFSPIDLLFYGIAGWEGYKFAFRVLDSQ